MASTAALYVLGPHPTSPLVYPDLIADFCSHCDLMAINDEAIANTRFVLRACHHVLSTVKSRFTVRASRKVPKVVGSLTNFLFL